MAGACGATEYLALVVPAPSEDSWHQSEQAAGRPWAERRRERGQEGKGVGLCQAAWAPTCELLPEAVPDGPPPPASERWVPSPPARPPSPQNWDTSLAKMQDTKRYKTLSQAAGESPDPRDP